MGWVAGRENVQPSPKRGRHAVDKLSTAVTIKITIDNSSRSNILKKCER